MAKRAKPLKIVGVSKTTRVKKPIAKPFHFALIRSKDWISKIASAETNWHPAPCGQIQMKVKFSKAKKTSNKLSKLAENGARGRSTPCE
ncbi:MAG: hypothetical protein QGI08_06225 [Paracoccaceae bacterium]|jgi:hypothetical protein|nr:hypothetical protein [Paracoccaceae bacterium]MDP7185300.1 hypothetical protein [Paracoccaceae bacterium]